MILRELIQATGVVSVSGDTAAEIGALAYDSRAVRPGSLFFALPGSKNDGAGFAADAAGRGAAGVVTQSRGLALTCPTVEVTDARVAMADMASAFWGQPSSQLKVLGVTGTNGKTTTAFLLKHLLDAVSLRCGLIGTVRYVVGEEQIDAPRTTPESADLQELLSRMLDAGSRSVAMEVSSHALVQHRVRGIAFDSAIFTNLTQDHLDYHGTMDAYFEAKASLFESLALQTSKRPRAVINADDRYGHLLLERFGKRLSMVTYGYGVSANFRAGQVRSDASGSTYQLEAKGRQYLVRLPLIGDFNIYNSLAALAGAASLGLEVRAAVAALADAPQIPGRLQRVPAKRNFQVYVDYAHTDDALGNVLRTLRELKPRRLIVVFGCGGDRDRAKRPLMAKAAERYADWTIITSDNPRSEDPEAIIADIEIGLRGGRHDKIVDRERAIRRAVELAEPGDIVLLAGKGHETYQEFSGRKIAFDDAAAATRAIADKPVVL